MPNCLQSLYMELCQVKTFGEPRAEGCQVVIAFCGSKMVATIQSWNSSRSALKLLFRGNVGTNMIWNFAWIFFLNRPGKRKRWFCWQKWKNVIIFFLVAWWNAECRSISWNFYFCFPCLKSSEKKVVWGFSVQGCSRGFEGTVRWVQWARYEVHGCGTGGTVGAVRGYRGWGTESRGGTVGRVCVFSRCLHEFLLGSWRPCYNMLQCTPAWPTSTSLLFNALTTVPSKSSQRGCHCGMAPMPSTPCWSRLWRVLHNLGDEAASTPAQHCTHRGRTKSAHTPSWRGQTDAGLLSWPWRLVAAGARKQQLSSGCSPKRKPGKPPHLCGTPWWLHSSHDGQLLHTRRNASIRSIPAQPVSRQRSQWRWCPLTPRATCHPSTIHPHCPQSNSRAVRGGSWAVDFALLDYAHVETGQYKSSP